MIRSVKDLIDYKIRAKDGDIGKVSEFYFDDERWTIRYLVADTGNWLSEKHVLISPAAFYDKPDWNKKEFPVILTKKMVEDSPSIEKDKPVSRIKEQRILEYYDWPIYWYPTLFSTVSPTIIPVKKVIPDTKEEETCIRSTKEVIGYSIHAKDGDIGHLHDFLIDDRNWKIKYIIVDTRIFLPGKKILIPPNWIKEVSWIKNSVYVDLMRETIKNAPHYDYSITIDRKYERRLDDYYKKSKNMKKEKVSV
ncbi:MAG: hypothetical protein A2474_05660 [Elusimicrobia bacterium RIFOXYC2_FULL_34_12]|nr:MAG: hypothetical protein A2474_05660 [Elusimicrobia bacterium RIFOXYC2_FULL_34_12]OGS38729.1 MAG: hypothetical protein A2551_04555 [Elusimicrobia bacterium RIFOXYD2_FULL_34_30]HAM38616.1 photosystem reaction center subunit H [Elusimicrobiota bacterium]